MIETVKNIVNIVLKDSKYLLIDVEVRGEKKNKIVEIYVDSRDKLDLDNLTDLNRKIWKKIEEAGLNENFSKITVSSPGIDRSFKYIEQLLKHTGRDIDIKLNDGTKISGTLENILEDEGQICLGIKGRKKEQSESNIKVIDFKNIKESKIKIKF
jgi:ribosome maturation factor RimP